jgi:hypothetical protein
VRTIIDAAEPERVAWIIRNGERILALYDLHTGRPQAALDRLQPLAARVPLDSPRALELYVVLAQALSIFQSLGAQLYTGQIEEALAQKKLD